jgi:hypothetical protein
MVEAYEQVMGPAARERQEQRPRFRGRPVIEACDCGWKGSRAEQRGPHHGDSCPFYSDESEAA